MQEAAQHFVGTHDFATFCTNYTEKQNTIRTIHDITIEKQGNTVILLVKGNGFLYNMVRIIAGTLVEVGEGRRSLADVKQALSTGERKKAGPTAPPEGLVLVEIREVP